MFRGSGSVDPSKNLKRRCTRMSRNGGPSSRTLAMSSHPTSIITRRPFIRVHLWFHILACFTPASKTATNRGSDGIPNAIALLSACIHDIRVHLR
jgi:hypothetical protein